VNLSHLRNFKTESLRCATFAACMVLAHVQLLFYRFGIGTVSVDAPLKAFEGIRIELRTLVPRTGDSAA
jgi:hypothetical protein